MALRALVLGVGLVGCTAPPGCGGETPPAVVTGDPNPAREPGGDAKAAAESSTTRRHAGGSWFGEGPAHEAMLAREQRDYDRALGLLDTYLAREGLSADDRAAALVLRGIEHRRADRYPQAAADFAAARGAASMAPIAAWIGLQQARALLEGGDADKALEVLAEVDAADDDQPSLEPDRLMAEAHALSRTGKPDAAADAYRRFLKKFPSDDRRFEARTRLAELIESSDPKGAIAQFEKVALAVPLSDYGDAADEGLDRLKKSGALKRSKKAQAAFDRQRELAEIEARLSRRAYRQVVEDVQKYARHKDISNGQRCRAHYAKASAVFKQRKRAESAPHYETADRTCGKAGDDDRVVKSRYQAARAYYAQGKYEKAGAAFEQLATDYPRHSYADDALVLAGESWESANAPKKAREAWLRAVDEQPDGDMAGEIRRRLLVQAFAEDRNEDALALIDKVLAKGAHRKDRAKLLYFRGRALQRLGREDEAVQAWISAIETMPLCYASAQALSRLRDAGEAPFSQGLAALEGKAEADADEKLPDLKLPASKAAARATIFARLGLGGEARAELDAADIDGWPAAAVLADAGLYEVSQRILANQGSDWRKTPPVGDARARYEVAHPVPFAEIIDPGEREHGVQRLLTFAVMQTESRFNPAATSWAGARGLVQLMPATAKGLAKSAGVAIDDRKIYDPRINLDLGMRYLARLEQRWGARDGAVALAVSSYNGGAGNVDKWLDQRGTWDLDLFIESIPFDETRRYTQSVLGRWMAYRWLYGEGQPSERLPYLPLQIPAKG